MKTWLRKLLLATLLFAGPSISFTTGFAMNAVVIAANGGQMPVRWPGGCQAEEYQRWKLEKPMEGLAIHNCMLPTSKLKFLGDWIVIRHQGVASPGDFLEWGGDAAQVPCMWMGFMYLLYELFRERENQLHP